MIYLWKILDDYPDNLIGEYDRETSPNRFLFKKGEYLPTIIGTPIFHFKATPKELQRFDDLANNALVPLVTPKVAAILCKICPNDVQLIDAIVIANREELREYKIVNVTHNVKGIDHDVSEYTLVPGTRQIMAFKKLRYAENCLGDLFIARDAEYSSNLLISKALRDEFISNDIQNLGLYRPEEVV